MFSSGMPKKPPIVGVFGGMGPLTGYNYLELLFRLIPAKADTDHPAILFWSDPRIPRKDRCIKILEENKAISPEDDARIGLKEGMDLFKFKKVSFVAVPCNTFHYFREELQVYSGVEILNMIAVVLKSILSKAPLVKKVGLLSTKSTAKYQIYDKEFNKANVDVVKPTEAEQDIVLEVIELVKQGKAHTEDARTKLEKVIKSLEAKGLDYIILGCTELSLVIAPSSYKGKAKLVDSTFELAKAVVYRVCVEMNLNLEKFKQLVKSKEAELEALALNQHREELSLRYQRCNHHAFYQDNSPKDDSKAVSVKLRARL